MDQTRAYLDLFHELMASQHVYKDLAHSSKREFHMIPLIISPRSSAFVFSVLLWALVPLTSYSQSSKRIASPATVHQPVINGELQWNKLLRRAGVPNNGLLLTARAPAGAVDLAKPINLVLSLQNVSDHRITIAGFRSDLPYAIVRDKQGTIIPFSKEGARRNSSSVLGYYLFSKRDVHVLDPGQANGYVLAIETLCVLDSPGEYDVMAVDSGLGCVAKPVSFSVTEIANAPQAVWQRAKFQCEDPSHSFGPKSPTNSDWSQLESEAGKPLEGAVLDAIVSPVNPGTLVVSIRGSDLEQNDNISAPNSALSAANYWLLVRDSLGRPVPMRANGLEPKSNSGTCKSLGARRVTLCRGSAIGAAIRLTQLFDMKRPGEYSVLVALPSSDSAGPVWVAAPVQYRVKAAQADAIPH